MAKDGAPLVVSAERVLAEKAGIVKPAKIVKVVPMGRGSGRYKRDGDQGVVKATKEKAYERKIRTAGDLPANIPADLVRTIEAAWRESMPVVTGYPLNDAETRILIGGVVGQVSLVFNAGGDSGVFVRSLTSSITHRCDSGPQALALASGEEEWPWVNGNKLV
jgi:hypothetical protein